MNTRQIFSVLLLVCAVVVLQGCSATAKVSSDTVAYMRGDLRSIESQDLTTIYESAELTVEQLELNIISKAKDALSAEIVVRDAEDKKITIRLTATTDGTTDVSIRVGLIGNETKARIIYQQIKKNM